jgi:hypothetical protein
MFQLQPLQGSTQRGRHVLGRKIKLRHVVSAHQKKIHKIRSKSRQNHIKITLKIDETIPCQPTGQTFKKKSTKKKSKKPQYQRIKTRNYAANLATFVETAKLSLGAPDAFRAAPSAVSERVRP